MNALAVIERELIQLARAAEASGDFARAAELNEARATAADLDEAARELLGSQSGPWERGNAYISARGAQNMNAAMKKTRAVLVRMNGAPA